jgi:hypothetical protein
MKLIAAGSEPQDMGSAVYQRTRLTRGQHRALQGFKAQRKPATKGLSQHTEPGSLRHGLFLGCYFGCTHQRGLDAGFMTSSGTNVFF